MCFLCSFLLLLLLLFGPSTRVGFNPTASHIKGPSRIVFLPTQVHGGDVRRLPGCYPENIPHCFSVTSVMFRFFFSRQHLLSQLLWTMLIYKSNFVYLARWRSTSPSLNLSAGEISRVKSLYGQANRHKKSSTEWRAGGYYVRPQIPPYGLSGVEGLDLNCPSQEMRQKHPSQVITRARHKGSHRN